MSASTSCLDGKNRRP